MMEVPTEADIGIRQLLARFADAVWRQDHVAFAGCFAPDGVWKIAGRQFEGRPAIEVASKELLGRCSHIHLITGMPLLQVDGDTARGRLAMTEFSRLHDGTTAMAIGWYHDIYVRLPAGWLFARRHWSLKYRGNPDLSGHFATTPDYGLFPGAPDPDEPTYVRSAGA